MTEYKKGEVPEELLMKAKNLKKSGKTCKKLSDDDVDAVAGGFRQKSGRAYGFVIECPNCGRNTREGIFCWEDEMNEQTDFYCDGCQCIWGVDEFGDVWESWEFEHPIVSSGL
ncbi:MAG: hypothetical protein K6E91_00665 [Butyrivibrio sp.]|nr:hypothetical protein [Butyrivibrio sp.]